MVSPVEPTRTIAVVARRECKASRRRRPHANRSLGRDGSGFRDDFGSGLLDGIIETVNEVINLDAARKASRLAHVPTQVLVVLSIYIVVTSAVLGYVLTGYRGQLAGAFLITLLIFSLTTIIDLDRPTTGSIVESQAPMELLRKSLEDQPSEVFDRWRNAESQSSLPCSPEELDYR
jgi:hypothetical protein